MNLRSLLGCRPRAPTGTTYFIDHDYGADDDTYVVRLVPPGETASPQCKQIGPTYTSDDEASKYRASLDGTDPAYRFPTGAA